jgi:hypothetical protein
VEEISPDITKTVIAGCGSSKAETIGGFGVSAAIVKKVSRLWTAEAKTRHQKQLQD